MKYNTVRERRRRELAELEIAQMEVDYEKLCGKIIVRQATQKEMDIINNMIGDKKRCNKY